MHMFNRWLDNKSLLSNAFHKFCYDNHDYCYSQWSNNGIQVTKSNDTFIECTSSHLTSFAVLVAPGGEVRY